MKELIEYIANELVEDKSQVVVKEIEEGGRIRIELQVSKEDMGRVIGKSGQVANAIRTLLKVAAAREGQQVNLDIVEPY